MFLNRIIVVAVVCSSLPLHADPYPFGRVFTTQEERKLLDDWRRNGNVPEENVEAATTEKTVQKPSLTKIELSGYMLREDGSAIVWINGKSELSATRDSVKTSKPNSGTLSVYHEGRRVRLKPGQAWMIDENQVKESYEVTAPKPLPMTNPVPDDGEKSNSETPGD